MSEGNARNCQCDKGLLVRGAKEKRDSKTKPKIFVSLISRQIFLCETGAGFFAD